MYAQWRQQKRFNDYATAIASQLNSSRMWLQYKAKCNVRPICQSLELTSSKQRSLFAFFFKIFPYLFYNLVLISV